MARCPGCNVPMTRTEEDGIPSFSCGTCFGKWMTHVSLLRRLRVDVKLAQAAADGGEEPSGQPTLADLAATVTVANTPGLLRCPSCGKPMQKDRVHQMVPVQIDRCKACDSFWLDAGELALVLRLYVEMSLTTDPRLVQLREKVAGVQLALEQRREAMADADEARRHHAEVTTNPFTLDVVLRMLSS